MKAICFRCKKVGIVNEKWKHDYAHVFFCPTCARVGLPKRKAQEEKKRLQMRRFSLISIGLLMNDICLQIAAHPQLNQHKHIQEQLDRVWGWTQKELDLCGARQDEELGEGRRKVRIPLSIVNYYERDVVSTLNDKHFRKKEETGQLTQAQAILASANAICWTLQELVYFHEPELGKISEFRFLLQTALTLEQRVFAVLPAEEAEPAEEYGSDIFLETLLPALSLRRAV